ncbi:hypothetical protein FRC18_005552 [Serendipita sp. 400]|nr:hypothetical protein FRC18_005552 [Serendipita sp. 400]
MSLIIDKNNSSGEGLQVLEASQHPTSSGAYLGTATTTSGEDALEADNCRPVRTVEGTVPSPTTVPSIDIPENRIISHTSLTGKDDTATSGEDESKGRQRTELVTPAGVGLLMAKIQGKIEKENAFVAVQQSILSDL